MLLILSYLSSKTPVNCAWIGNVGPTGVVLHSFFKQTKARIVILHLEYILHDLEYKDP